MSKNRLRIGVATRREIFADVEFDSILAGRKPAVGDQRLIGATGRVRERFGQEIRSAVEPDFHSGRGTAGRGVEHVRRERSGHDSPRSISPLISPYGTSVAMKISLSFFRPNGVEIDGSSM